MDATGKPQVLRNNRQFRSVYDRGRRFHTPYFSAFILKTETLERRFGITVTKKVGSAVIRNRCKRRIREALRRYLSNLDSGSQVAFGYDLVINARLNLLTADFKEIEDSLASVIERFYVSLSGTR